MQNIDKYLTQIFILLVILIYFADYIKKLKTFIELY